MLFGFQSTAGLREADRVECVRWGATGLDVAPLHGRPTAADRDLLARVLTGNYQPKWTHDFEDWLLCHAAMVLPVCFVSYFCGCDLHTASRGLLHQMTAAQGEGHALLAHLGHLMVPEGRRDLFDGGVRARAWNALIWIGAHTTIGTFCADNHCKHAPKEMRDLDVEFERLRKPVPEFAMPNWDGLLAQMGGWDDVCARWDRGRS